MVEPIQGEAGVVVPQENYMAKAKVGNRIPFLIKPVVSLRGRKCRWIAVAFVVMASLQSNLAVVGWCDQIWRWLVGVIKPGGGWLVPLRNGPKQQKLTVPLCRRKQICRPSARSTTCC
jgi:hypothetical protein